MKRSNSASSRYDYAPTFREGAAHGVYRVPLRGVRMRWFGSGCVLGMLVGVVLTLVASALVVTQVPAVTQIFTGEPDVSVVIGEAYLNRQAARRINGSYPTGVSNLTLTALNIDLNAPDRMDLQPTFRVDVGFTTLSISPKVNNQLIVQDGKLAIKMLGDPQLGNLNVPLEALPFDLKSQVAQAVDKINNSLLLSEINQSLQAGFGNSQFIVQGVSAGDTTLSIRLQGE